MKIAVWDTYVRKKDGNTLHFDILVPQDLHDENKIFQFGREYLNQKQVDYEKIDAENCQFCHVEIPNENVVKKIEKNGYAIVFLEEIPKELPENPSRRDMILHIRANLPHYRFMNFKDVSNDELKEIIASELRNDKNQHP